MTKITKRERYESIRTYFETIGVVDGVDVDGIIEFCDAEIAALDRKAAKAKETAAKKRAEGDELTNAVLAAVGDEFESIADIAARIEGDDVSLSKVAYRLNAAFKAGTLEKGELTIEGDKGKRKVVAYRNA